LDYRETTAAAGINDLPDPCDAAPVSAKVLQIQEEAAQKFPVFGLK
jgi:hypothetical protein